MSAKFQLCNKKNVGKLPTPQRGVSAKFQPSTMRVSAKFKPSVSAKFQLSVSAKLSVLASNAYPDPGRICNNQSDLKNSPKHKSTKYRLPEA